jgi:hypothetical protein
MRPPSHIPRYDALLDLLADLVIEEIEQEADLASTGAASPLVATTNKKPAASWQTSPRAEDFNDAKITRAGRRRGAG